MDATITDYPVEVIYILVYGHTQLHWLINNYQVQVTAAIFFIELVVFLSIVG